MLINNWYVATESDALKEQPVRVQILGVDLVLFRDDKGNAACLADVCCHRGGALSRGVVSDGCVSCPYHGWKYNRLGNVVEIPALGDDAKIPKRARVDSYPIEERYGYVWTFLGDMPDVQRPALPDFLPEYDDRETWRIARVQRDWNVNWMRLGENLVDSSHLSFVHQFGKHIDPKMKILAIEETEWGAQYCQSMAARPKGGNQTKALEDVLPDDRKKAEVDLRFSLLGMMHRNRQVMAPGVTQLLWNAWVPIDESHTRLFSLQLRTYKKEPELDDQMLEAIRYGLDEDASIIEYVEPVVAPETNANELIIETDGMESTFRRKTREMTKKLGAIDIRKFERERKYQVLVIPSPARRQDNKNWMHKTVPLMDSNTQISKSTAAQ